MCVSPTLAMIWGRLRVAFSVALALTLVVTITFVNVRTVRLNPNRQCGGHGMDLLIEMGMAWVATAVATAEHHKSE